MLVSGALSGTNAIVPSSAHVPPRPAGASHSVTAAPPVAEIFFNLPSAKKAIHWPSGEKNGSRTFSPAAKTVACS
jgi:hypothetical protein